MINIMLQCHSTCCHVSHVPVPCYKRVSQVDTHEREQEKVLEEEGDSDGGWVDTHHFAGGCDNTFITLVATHCSVDKTSSLLVKGLIPGQS